MLTFTQEYLGITICLYLEVLNTDCKLVIPGSFLVILKKTHDRKGYKFAIKLAKMSRKNIERSDIRRPA